MSNEAPNRDGTARTLTAPGPVSTLRSTTARVRERALALPVGGIAGVLTVGTVGSALALRVATNAPVAVPSAVADLGSTFAHLAFVGPALALLVLSVATGDAASRFGLVLAGVFGLLAAVEPAASVPAAGAIVAGGAVAAGTVLGRPTDYYDARRVGFAVAAFTGVVLTLASAFGVATSALRPAGAVVAMVALGGTPVFVRAGALGWFLGGLAAVGVLAFAATSPFVAGAVLLVAVGAVGVPALVVAVGLAGGVAALAGGVRDRRLPAALGAACLLCAGVPSTLPAALAVTVGIVLLVRSVADDSASPRGGASA